MRARAILSALSLAFLAAASVACGDFSDAASAPEDDGPPGGPTQPPPTGGKWEGRETTDECGRTTIEWILVDEICAGTDSPDYLEHFRAPIMRDGALIGTRLYTVDATHLWVLDVSVANTPVRTALLAGFGQPLAAATHGGRLLLAAGGEGLIIADVSEPDAPHRLATIATEGPALDVFVDGDLAYVATGHGGIVVVDLAVEEPAVLRVLELDEFAAGVAVQDGIAYAAACEAVVTLDAESGDRLGSTWLEDAHDEDGRLVAPAKDVVVAGDQIFVAAGRYGAVRVDVSSPSTPAVVGNCTLEEELGFYASGVRTQDERLFVAGGEWGILPVELDPETACTTRITPVLIPPEGGDDGGDEDGECSSVPPWEVLPWEESWLPPVQAGQDPLQTLPAGEVLFAFGDATRIGMRAVDVRIAEADDLEKIGRFDEPRLAQGIAAQGDRVLVLGQRGGLFQRTEDGLVRAEDDAADAQQAVDGAFLEDGRWVVELAEPRRVVFEGGLSVSTGGVDERAWPGTLATHGTRAYLGSVDGVLEIDADAGYVTTLYSGRPAVLPAAVSADDSGVVIAAPEWADALRVADSGAEPLGAHGVFGAQQVESADEWRLGLPRRLLASTSLGVLELATLGRRAGVALHLGSTPATLELPPGEYVDLIADGERAYAVSLDRGTYRSQVVVLELDGGTPRIVGIDAWTGMAAGIAATADSVYIADRDQGVRIYDIGADGLTLSTVATLLEDDL